MEHACILALGIRLSSRNYVRAALLAGYTKKKGPVQTWCPCLGTSLNIAFCCCPSTIICAPCPGTGSDSRGSTRAPCSSTGNNLNRFSSVPSVFTFSQAVEARTPNLSPISRKLIRFPSCLWTFFVQGTGVSEQRPFYCRSSVPGHQVWTGPKCFFF